MQDGHLRYLIWALIGGVVLLVVVERQKDNAPGVATAVSMGQEARGDRADVTQAADAIPRGQRARDRLAHELGYYPPAPSTAGSMTSKWREFADQVDQICGVTYNQMMASMSQAEAFGQRRGWSEERTEEAMMRISANQGVQIIAYTNKLGEPPRRAGLFSRWREMVAQRASLRSRAAEAAGEGRWHEYRQLCDRNSLLKRRGDVIGQRFGLRICTSN